MIRKGYDYKKTVTLGDVNCAFISYLDSIELTRTEYLFLANIYEVVIEKLINNTGGDKNE